MAATGNNDTKYVSTTQGVSGGYCYVAPSASAVLPTGLADALDATWTCAGYISEDGFTESTESDSEDYKDMNGDVVHSGATAASETIQCKFIETAETPLKLFFGSDNVETGADGTITVTHNWGKASTDNWALVFELVLKNGRRWRKVISSAQVSERGEFTGSSTELAGYEITFKYLGDTYGVTCKDYFEGISEPAGASLAAKSSTTSTTSNKSSN